MPGSPDSPVQITKHVPGDAVRTAVEAANSPGAWWEPFARILTKAGQLAGGILRPGEVNEAHVPLVANKLQERIDAAVQYCLDHRLPIRLLVLKPRQKGCSTYLVGVLYWLMRTTTRQCCIIGGKLKQVRSLWGMLQRYFNNDKHKWANEGQIGATEGTFTNGSTCIKETAKDAEAGRAHTLHGLICTEVARWSEYGVANAGEVLNGIENCVPDKPGSFEALESTARGPSGPFYERWIHNSLPLEEFAIRHRKGTLGTVKFIQVFAGWHEFDESWEIGGEKIVLTDLEKAELQDSLEEHERWMMVEHGVALEQIVWYRRTKANECQDDSDSMKREYPTTWEEAFSASVNSRFDKAALEIMRNDALELQEQGSIRFGHLDDKYAWVEAPEKEARLAVVERPMGRNKYILVVDPATGECMTEGEDPDCHAVVVIRKGYDDPDRGWRPDRVVASVLPEDRRDIDVVEEDVWRLSQYYGGCCIVVEANKDAGFITLLKQRGANLYERELSETKKRFKKTGVYGFQTKFSDGDAGQSRRAIIDNAAGLIREHGEWGSGLDLSFPWIAQEFITFVNYDDGKPRAMEGCHDDFVMAVLIGLMTKEHATVLRRDVHVPDLPSDLKRAMGRGGRGQKKRNSRGYR